MLRVNHSIIKTVLALVFFVSVEAQAANLCGQVWTSSVERIRVQEQSSGETVVRVYLYPGTTSEYVGYTTSDFMVDVLLKSKDKMAEITGYSDSSCKIKWVDFR